MPLNKGSLVMGTAINCWCIKSPFASEDMELKSRNATFKTRSTGGVFLSMKVENLGIC